jgi:hypothetical protein
LESDPIGLAGGSYSTFGYAAANPLSRIDRYGLQEEELPGGEETEEQREENSSESLLRTAEAESLLAQVRAIEPDYGEALPPGYRRSESDIRDLRATLQKLQAQRSCSNPNATPLRRIHSDQTLDIIDNIPAL